MERLFFSISRRGFHAGFERHNDQDLTPNLKPKVPDSHFENNVRSGRTATSFARVSRRDDVFYRVRPECIFLTCPIRSTDNLKRNANSLLWRRTMMVGGAESERSLVLERTHARLGARMVRSGRSMPYQGSNRQLARAN